MIRLSSSISSSVISRVRWYGGIWLRGEKAQHRDWIYSHLDDGRVLRDQRWLLEIAKGGRGEKFFDCGDCRDGTGYQDVPQDDL